MSYRDTDGYWLHEIACRWQHIDQCAYHVGGDDPTRYATAARKEWEEKVNVLLDGIAEKQGRGRHESR